MHTAEVADGYLVMAFGPKRYYDMAVNLAASLRLVDPGRRICLLHDDAMSADVGQYFNDLKRLPQDPRYPHLMNKLRAFELSPYARTMFVDADCLLIKPDIDDTWRRAGERSFSITGETRTTGTWKGIDIPEALCVADAPYLIQMNSGVLYFDKSTEAARFFDEVNRLYLSIQDAFGHGDLCGGKGQTDEIYLGLTMGRLGMDADNMRNHGRNWWMVSTWRSVYTYANPGRGALVLKAANFAFEKPYLPSRVVPLTPTFLHFVGLKPRRLYDRLATVYRQRLHETSAVPA